MKTGETAGINLNLLYPRHYSKAIYNLNYLFQQTKKKQDFNGIHCLFVKKNTSYTFLSVFCFTFRRFRTIYWDHCMVHRPRSTILPTVGGHNHYYCLVLKVSTMFTSTVNQIYNIIYSLTCNWSVVLLTARYIICQLTLLLMKHWPSPSLRWYMYIIKRFRRLHVSVGGGWPQINTR